MTTYTTTLQASARLSALAILILATPAMAQDAAAVGASATADLVTSPADDTPVCVDDMCFDIVDAPVLELDAEDGEVTWQGDAPRLWRAKAPSSSQLRGFGEAATSGEGTMIGEFRPNRASAADEFLPTESSAMPRNFSDVEAVDGVTGLGFVSKF